MDECSCTRGKRLNKINGRISQRKRCASLEVKTKKEEKRKRRNIPHIQRISIAGPVKSSLGVTGAVIMVCSQRMDRNHWEKALERPADTINHPPWVFSSILFGCNQIV
jgi:hypothetical protein